MAKGKKVKIDETKLMFGNQFKKKGKTKKSTKKSTKK